MPAEAGRLYWVPGPYRSEREDAITTPPIEKRATEKPGAYKAAGVDIDAGRFISARLFIWWSRYGVLALATIWSDTR